MMNHLHLPYYAEAMSHFEYILMGERGHNRVAFQAHSKLEDRCKKVSGRKIKSARLSLLYSFN